MAGAVFRHAGLMQPDIETLEHVALDPAATPERPAGERNDLVRCSVHMEEIRHLRLAAFRKRLPESTGNRGISGKPVRVVAGQIPGHEGAGGKPGKQSSVASDAEALRHVGEDTIEKRKLVAQVSRRCRKRPGALQPLNRDKGHAEFVRHVQERLDPDLIDRLSAMPVQKEDRALGLRRFHPRGQVNVIVTAVHRAGGFAAAGRLFGSGLVGSRLAESASHAQEAGQQPAGKPQQEPHVSLLSQQSSPSIRECLHEALRPRHLRTGQAGSQTGPDHSSGSGI